MKNISFSDLKVFQKTDEGKWVPNFRRDWAIIVSSVFVAVSFVVVFHSLTYFKMISDNYFIVATPLETNSSHSIKKIDLDRVIASFENKKKLFEQISSDTLPEDISVKINGLNKPVSPVTTTNP